MLARVIAKQASRKGDSLVTLTCLIALKAGQSALRGFFFHVYLRHEYIDYTYV